MTTESNIRTSRHTTPGYRWRWVALAGLLIAEAMNLLDTTIVQVASPAIRDDLAATDGQMQWLTAGYTLPFAMLLITGGRLGDIHGRKRIFVFGMLGFVLSSAVCALTPSVSLLLIMRVSQGASAALIIPQTFGLIRTMFTGNELAKALGMIGPVMAVATVCGPVLGGALTDANLLDMGWRSVFLINLPLGAAVGLAVPRIPEGRSPKKPRLDLIGTVLVTIAVGLLIYPTVQRNDYGWPLWTWACIGFGLIGLVAFVRHQSSKARRSASTLIEPGLFRNRAFPASLLSSLLFFAVMNGLMFVFVVYFQVSLRMNAYDAGLAMLPWSAGLAIGSIVTGSVLIQRFGARVMRAGVFIVLVGLLATVSILDSPAPGLIWKILLPFFLTGIGLSMFTVPFFTNALSHVDDHETGSASGLLNAVQQLGSTLGVALLGAAFFHLSKTTTQSEPAAAIGVQLALYVSVGLLIMVMSLTVPMLKR